jgi:hypothetical protein
MQQQQRHCQAPLFAVQMPDGRRVGAAVELFNMEASYNYKV